MGLTLKRDLEALVEPTTRGDPMSPLCAFHGVFPVLHGAVHHQLVKISGSCFLKRIALAKHTQRTRWVLRFAQQAKDAPMTEFQ